MPIRLVVDNARYWNPGIISISCNSLFCSIIDAVDAEGSLVDKLKVLQVIELELSDAWFIGKVKEKEFKIALVIVDSVMIAYLGMTYGFHCASIANNCDSCLYNQQCQNVKASLYYDKYQPKVSAARWRARSIIDAHHHDESNGCYSTWDTHKL